MKDLHLARAAILIAFLATAPLRFSFSAAVTASDDDNSYVLSLEDNDLFPEPNLPGPPDGTAPEAPHPSNPDISYMHVHSKIRYRYSTTLVTCRAANHYLFSSKELGFQIVLPNSAYISKFIMDIDGKSYEAYVKEKEEARNIYNQARSQGRTGGLVEVSARDSNVFNLNITLKPSSNITFNLTYEEFLFRRFGHYEQIINVNPEHITKIPDFKVTVSIAESQNISFLRVPRPERSPDLKMALIRQGREANDKPLNASDTRNVQISRPNPRSAVIEWALIQTEMRTLETDEMNGKFIVQYDVARPNAGGDILLMNGYFVHFFAPHELYPLRKHMIFVLDVSGSMSGRKIEQLRNAMKFVLDDLKPDDYFNIITFSSGVQGWNPETSTPLDNGWRNVWTRASTSSYYRTPIMATEDNLRKGHRFIDSLNAAGGTDINSALLEALNLASTVKSALPSNVDSAILFLTDGEPTTGVTDLTQIYENVRKSNSAPNMSSPIPTYSLAFGDSADFNFIKKLALQNHGFGRKIYEAADADLQLKGFYKEISSPMLSNATFRYTTNANGTDSSGIEQLTQVRFATVFNGSEVVVAGKLRNYAPSSSNFPIIVDIDGRGRNGRVSFGVNDVVEYDISGADVVRPAFKPDNATTSRDAEDELLERFWAYLTIKQLIEKDLQGTSAAGNGIDDDSEEIEENDEEFSALLPIPTSAPEKEPPKERALKLSLKYGFVTPLTSLVVVKPNDTESTNTLTEAPPPSETKSRSVNLGFAGWSPSSSRGSSRTVTAYSYPTTIASLPWSPSSQGVPSLSADSAASGRSLLQFPIRRVDSLRYKSPSQNSFDLIGTRVALGDVEARRPQLLLPGARSSSISAARMTTLTTPYRPSTSTRTTSTTTAPSPSTTAIATSRSSIPNGSRTRELSLDDISWLPNAMNYYGPVWINGIAYQVATRRTPVLSPAECFRRSQPINSTTTIEEDEVVGVGGSIPGVCTHLRDCVRPEFVHDAQVYYDNYFCPLRSKRMSSQLYAGACC